MARNHTRQMMKKGQAEMDKAIKSLQDEFQQYKENSEKRLQECKEFYEDLLKNTLEQLEPCHNIPDQPSIREAATRNPSRPHQHGYFRLPKFTKGDNKLMPETDFSLWKRRIRFELLSQDCLFLVEKDQTSREQYPDTHIDQMRSSVMSYLLSNLDQKYQRQVRYSTDPVELLNSLEKMCESISMNTEHELRKKLYKMTYHPKEQSVLEFLTQFDELTEKIRKCPDAHLTDPAIKHTLLMAFSDALPEIVGAFKREPRPGRSIAELKELLLAEEDDLKVLHNRTSRNETETNENALMASTSNKHSRNYGSSSKYQISQKKPKIQCKNCGLNGHTASFCRRPGRICYICKEFGHLSTDCPQASSNMTQKYREKDQQPSNSKDNQESSVWFKFYCMMQKLFLKKEVALINQPLTVLLALLHSNLFNEHLHT
ncbi:hypothetical protein GE061_018951 [Apolygus lucorum]|uniref:CCHC-type domain-containing protein n=1 Tax=Apolygus lucorum TaxID=248454 RepID=A0A8S9X8D4_APOLU|nr:hypothetical protein GE061_018951 [Apolygus lucorum]